MMNLHKILSALKEGDYDAKLLLAIAFGSLELLPENERIKLYGTRGQEAYEKFSKK